MTTTLELGTKAAALVPHPHPTLLAIAASAALLVPGTLVAQFSLTPARVEVTALATAGNSARADTLEELAARYPTSVRQWRQAAQYYEQAATLRDDGRAVTNLVTAAWLYDGAGNSAHARWTMERAAKRAEAMGDVERAANAYVDAAFLAVAAKRVDLVPKLLRQTHAVLDSPNMPPDRREAILQRIGDEATIAQIVKRP